MNINQYINDGQDPKTVEKLLLKLQDMLTSDEIVSYIAVQKKPAVTLFPDSIVLTNKRIFRCESTKLGLATDFIIFPWKTIKEISFKEGVLGSKFIVVPVEGENIELGYIPKSQVRKLYQLGQEALERQRDATRQKAAPAPMVETEEATPPPQPRKPEDELTLKLQKLKSLFESELITQAEYDNKKNELLSQL